MGTLRRPTGEVPRHRAAAGPRWIGALPALVAVGVIGLASAVLLLPGHSAPPAARGCGLMTCTHRQLTAAAGTAESGASLRGATQTPARASAAPARPGARATPSPSPSPLTPRHGRANGRTHRHHGR